MMPLKSNRTLMRHLKRILPTTSDSRGVAKATYRSGPVSWATLYLTTNPQTRQAYGITDGSVYTAFFESKASVGDRLQDIDTDELYEVLESSKHINGWSLTLKRV